MADGSPQLSIVALNTTTPNLADLSLYIYREQCTYTYGRIKPPCN